MGDVFLLVSTQHIYLYTKDLIYLSHAFNFLACSVLPLASAVAAGYEYTLFSRGRRPRLLRLQP